MADPLVSIIIPSYNAEDTIYDTVKSVLNQSYSMLEVIIVDDCSTDKTPEIIEEICSKHKNVQFYKLDENFGGPAKPRNIGIEKSSGEYIAFIDADDIWHPEKTKAQLKYMILNNVLISCSKRENFHSLADLKQFQRINELTSKTINLEKLLQKNWTNTSSMIVKREALNKLRFNTQKKLIAVEDFHLWCSVLQKNNTLMHIINEKLLCYRVHKNSISRNKFKMIKKFYLVNRDFNPIAKSFLNTFKYILKSLLNFRT